MQHLRAISFFIAALAAPAPSSAAAQQITEIIDASGDGIGNPHVGPVSVVADASGNVYEVCRDSDNAFKIAPTGAITEIIDADGDGNGNPLLRPECVAVDASGNVYVTGMVSNNAFQITPAGAITELIDESGDGAGKVLTAAMGIAVDGLGNVFVAGHYSDNVFKIDPAGTVTEILDETGGGLAILDYPYHLAADQAGNVYVPGWVSNNVFQVSRDGTIRLLLDESGGGSGYSFTWPRGIAVSRTGNVYVTALSSAFRIAPGGVVTRIITTTGDGKGNTLSGAKDVAVDLWDNAYVVATFHQYCDDAFKITPGGTITHIIGPTGDGAGKTLDGPEGIAVDDDGNVYVTGAETDNAFKIGDPWPGEPGVGYCFGDPGSGTPCPCDNDNDGSVPGSGCDNGVFPSGAKLAGTGVARLTKDTLVLTTTHTEPYNSGLYFQGNGALDPSVVWGDGLRCVELGIVRLQTRMSDAGGTSNTTVAIGAKGGAAAGDTKYYQLWYRTTALPPCGYGVNDFNSSNGYAIAWAP